MNIYFGFLILANLIIDIIILMLNELYFEQYYDFIAYTVAFLFLIYATIFLVIGKNLWIRLDIFFNDYYVEHGHYIKLAIAVPLYIRGGIILYLLILILKTKMKFQFYNV